MPIARAPCRLPLRLAAAVLGATLAATGCGTQGPTTAPSGATPSVTPGGTAGPPTPAASGPPGSGVDSSAVYASIRADVIAIRGLQPSKAVDPVTIDATQLRSNLESEFDTENPPAQLKASEDLLIALGLLPAGASLKQITLDFQAGQVAGYYSPEKDELFVVSRSGQLGAAELVTYAHEFTHQLQDQRIDLGKLGIDVPDQSDRSLARLAVVEGDAVSVQTAWMLANLDSEQLGELLASALDPKALAALQNAPAFVRETALFPYQDGVAFVTRLKGSADYAAIDAVYAAPPDSTEQILHPEKYLAREQPIQVSLPANLASVAGAGWSEAGRDTLGELILRIWLTAGGVPAAQAKIATAGWGGDRVALLRGPGGATGLGIQTTWDTATDADEFAAAATTAFAALALAGSVQHAAGSSTVSIAIGPTSAQLLAALGD
ncbi:MAG TPA: hypothetical protein VM451_09510 [Candidatus Limnocylindria bacterium]|nr:hypothetical protein [Candidatus Limnocylindria bacterium]